MHSLCQLWKRRVDQSITNLRPNTIVWSECSNVIEKHSIAFQIITAADFSNVRIAEPTMYWPLGVASVFAPPQDGDLYGDRQDQTKSPFVSLSRTPSGNLLATATEHELFLWQTHVTALSYLESSYSHSPWPSLHPCVGRPHPWKAMA